MNVSLNSNLNALEPAPLKQFTKTINPIGTPVPLVATRTEFRKAIVFGKKAPQTDNVGIVYLGATDVATEQPYAISPGDVVFFEMPVGARDDFANWYLDAATDDDGVTILYW